ncbi:diguanylate cyclase [Novosphingobium sp.]|uniref:GGDEF domain-containing protein n=1 Tax=Novosphingobium sp. TaxID=1874826 RepID=UPI0027347BE7|nr:GGDEF domain-containing protein [Novosphingobium sp.]MDP3908000.1 GGDEF domain-containing protein [Novosphingobium sp.]
MTAHDPSLHRPVSDLLSWLGLGHRPEPATPLVDVPAGQDRRERRDAQRQRMLDEIGSFLSYHHLEVTAQTLTIAFNYLSGADPQLARSIDRQMQARQPVTLDWIEDVLSRSERSDELAVLTQLMRRLEVSIEDFSKTSHDAQQTTNDYNTALEEHVTELEQVTAAGAVISELATIAKVMLKRTRDIERQMVRSKAQTRVLKRRLAETRRKCEEDHLTGLPNRRAFETRFDEEYRQALAAAEPLCVAFFDIDNFKRINDSHGHDAGDFVLQLVAESLSRISDERCHVARHGGEEFVVLFRDTPLADAFAKLDALRVQLAERRLVNRATDVPFGQITFSAGIADVFAFPDRRAALKAADAALYRAKQSGRNRIEVAQPDDVNPPG